MGERLVVEGTSLPRLLSVVEASLVEAVVVEVRSGEVGWGKWVDIWSIIWCSRMFSHHTDEKPNFLQKHKNTKAQTHKHTNTQTHKHKRLN